MALNYRELFYMVRVANYATRPLRALGGDFRRLSHESDLASKRLLALDQQQRKVAASAELRRASIAGMRAGTDVGSLRIARQQAALDSRVAALKTRRISLDQSITAAERKIVQLEIDGEQIEKTRLATITKQRAAYDSQYQAIQRNTAALAAQRETLTSQIRLVPAQRSQLFQRQLIAQQRVADAVMRAQRVGLKPEQIQAGMQARFSRADWVRVQQVQIAKAVTAYNALGMQIKKLDDQEVGLANRMRVLGESEIKLAADSQKLATSLRINVESLAAFDRQAATNAAAIDAQRKQIAGYVAELGALANVQRRLTADERMLITARLDHVAAIAKEDAALAGQMAELKRLSVAIQEQQAIIAASRFEHLNRIGQTLSHLGRTAQYAGGLTVIALGYMAKGFADLQQKATYAATQAANTVAGVQQASGQITGAILNQMKQFPARADDMAKSFYDIYSTLKVTVPQGVLFSRVFNQAAVAGMAPLNDTTNAGITIMKQFGDESASTGKRLQQLHGFMNTMFAAVRFGRMTVAEFAQTLGTTAPAAKSAGQGFENLAGTMAFLTPRLGLQKSAIGYARLLEMFQRSAPGLKSMGVNIKNSLGQLIPLPDILARIAKRFPQVMSGRKDAIAFFKEITKGTGVGTMGTVQARRAFTFLTQQMAQYRDILKSAGADTNEFDKSLAAMSKTPGVRFQVFVNQLRELTMELGRGATPALLKMLKPLQDAVKWFESLNTRTKDQIATTVAWAGGLTVAAGTLSLLVGSVIRIGTSVRSLSGHLLMTKGSMAALEGEAGAVTAIMARRFGIVALIAVMIKFHNQTFAVINALGGLKNILGFVSFLLGVRMVKNFALMAASALTAAGVIVPAETAIGTGAERAAVGVGTLTTAMTGLLARLGPLLVLFAAYETFFNKQKFDQGVTGFLRGHGLGFVAGQEDIPIRNQKQTLATMRNLNEQVREAQKFGDESQAGLQREFLTKLADRSPLFVKTRQQAIKLATQLRAGIAGARKAGDDTGVAYRQALLKRLATAFPVTQLTPHFLALDKLYRTLGPHFTRRPEGFGRGPGGAADMAAEAEARAVEAARRQQAFAHPWWESAQQAIKQIERAKQVAQRSPTLRNWKRYYDLLDALSKKFQGAQLEAVQQLLSAEESATKKSANLQLSMQLEAARKALSNAKDLARQAQDNVKTALSNVQQLYQGFLDQEQQAFGTLFEGPFSQSPRQQNLRNWGFPMSSADLLKDLQSQVTGFRNWHRQLDTLGRRGAPRSLVKALTALGPSASKELQQLLNMSPRQWREYLAIWQRGQRMVHDQAMRDLHAQLAEYRKFGRNIALAIVEGLKDENVAMQKAITAMLRRMFPELFTRADTARARERAAQARVDELRRRRARGQGPAPTRRPPTRRPPTRRQRRQAVQAQARPRRELPQRAIEMRTRAQPIIRRQRVVETQIRRQQIPTRQPRMDIARPQHVTHNVKYEDHMHVHATKMESLDSTLNRAFFRMRNRRR